MSKKDREIRWVKTIKSNFDKSDYTPVRLILDGERRLSFEEMPVEEDEAPQKSKIETAMEIISEMHEDGPQSVSEINAACAEEGIGEKTAQRAMKRLGAIQDYENGGYTPICSLSRWLIFEQMGLKALFYKGFHCFPF